MIVHAAGVGDAAGRPLSARCPACRQLGTFEVIGRDLALASSDRTVLCVGHRRCPNPQCMAHIFVVVKDGGIATSYPPLRIDFDAVNVPAGVVKAFEEAVTCHANDCFVASALMIRKALEELCQDRQAKGANLKERIRSLGNKIVLPQELLDGLDELRLLGNDAAHIESREYDKVGKEEVEVGIEFTKEVLKATYQYSALLGRLRSLKNAP